MSAPNMRDRMEAAAKALDEAAGTRRDVQWAIDYRHEGFVPDPPTTDEEGTRAWLAKYNATRGDRPEARLLCRTVTVSAWREVSE